MLPPPPPTALWALLTPKSPVWLFYAQLRVWCLIWSKKLWPESYFHPLPQAGFFGSDDHSTGKKGEL